MPKKKITSYLEQLTFDPALTAMKIAGYLTNVRLVALFVIGIIIFGAFSFFSLPRRLNPEIKIPIVSVITAYPGAGPSEVEELVTIPLESKLSNAKHLQTLSSTSQDNVSIITAEFTSGITVEDARQEIQKLVGQVSDLPDDAMEPTIRELDFEDVPVWDFVLTTSGSRATLERAARLLEEELEANGKIDRLAISGIETQEIQILLDPQKVADYGITPMQLASIIKAETKSLPTGTVVTENNAYSFSIEKTISTIDDIRALPLNLRGSQVLLGDIATVQYKSTANQKRSYVSTNEFTNQQAVTLSVYKTSTADITDAQQTAEEIVNETLEKLDGAVKVINLENVAEDISDQFSDLYSNFASTIFLVFATLFIFLGLRQAAIASLSIPLTFLISLITMQMTGQSLNFLTLFSLLLALGLLVDDAIVIISAMTTYYKTKKFSATETGLLVWRDFLVPIWTTTITTVWAFVPLLLSSGIIGEFIKPIPIVVSSTLLASTTVAVLITLPMMMVLLNLKVPKRVSIMLKVLIGITGLVVLGSLTAGQPLGMVVFLATIAFLGLLYSLRTPLTVTLRKSGTTAKVTKAAKGGFINMEAIAQKYQDLMNAILISASKMKKVVIAVLIVSLFSYALLPMGFVKNEFFPKTDSELIYVTLELPTGSNLATTERAALDISQSLTAIPEYTLVTTRVGEGNRSSTGSNTNGDNLAAITVRVTAPENRHRSSEAISAEVKSLIDAADIESKVYTESGGPPAGSDVTVKITGDELGELQRIADQLLAKLNTMEGVKNGDRSIKQGNSKLAFQPDLQRLTEYGVTSQEIAFWSRTALSGFELTTTDFNLANDETTISMYLSDALLTPEQLSEIQLLTQRGPVPISQLGTISMQPTPSVITREDGKRTLTITADVATGYNAGQINAEILEFADTIQLERGYSFATGGANEENQKSVMSIMQAMVLSLILIIATMVIQLGSFRQSLIVILVIPLAISGVFIMFALTGTPLSFPALIGVLALFGIVVNNSIMVVEKINQNRAIGMEKIAAITDAAASRLEPIFFSSLTTIIGLIPITLSDPLWRGLGGAIIAGLLFSGGVMLLVIPVAYSYMFPEEK